MRRRNAPLHSARLAAAGLALAGCAAEAERPPGPPTDDAAPLRETITTDAAPAAIGPYSQAVRVGPTLYLAGQIGLDPATGELVAGGIRAETRRVMENLRAVLEAAGMSLEHAVQSQVFLADLADFDAMNEIYAEFFDRSPPARATVEVARLPRDARIEISMIAVESR